MKFRVAQEFDLPALRDLLLTVPSMLKGNESRAGQSRPSQPAIFQLELLLWSLIADVLAP